MHRLLLAATVPMFVAMGAPLRSQQVPPGATAPPAASPPASPAGELPPDAVARATKLVAQLANDAERAAARAQLLALGAAAIGPIGDALAAATEPHVRELLDLTLELGPIAAPMLPRLVDRLEFGGPRAVSYAMAIAELAPWRAPDLGVDADTPVQRARSACADLTSTAGRFAQLRLQKRFAFPRDLDVATARTFLAAPNPLRVEYGIDSLARRGPAALAALPDLRLVLARPEPRVLGSEQTVPLHGKAARAVLAIAPDDELAAVARTVLTRSHEVPSSAPRAEPLRLAARVRELTAELAAPATRAAASANLTALGAPAAVPVAELLATAADAETLDAALAVLRELGPRGAAAVPHLVAATTALPAEHLLATLRTLEATAPWATDVVLPVVWSGGLGGVSIGGTKLTGRVDHDLLNGLHVVSRTLTAALRIDPHASHTELRTFLTGPSLANRLRALDVIAAGGAEARPLLPLLGELLVAGHPREDDVRWIGDATFVGRVDGSAKARRRVATAILAVAAPGDPLLVDARDVLARGAPAADDPGK